MNKINIKKLNIFKISLNGLKWIEASAGTGKTFTIVLLYLRLLLGVGNQNNCIKKLSVHEILVVTFTKKSKEELYIRIKKNIENLYLACISKTSKYNYLNEFLEKIENLKEAMYLLKKAKNEINTASIYTIHGFFQQILQLNKLDFHSVFQKKIIENEDDLYLQATEDFWRFFFYSLPKDIVKIVHQEYKNPEYLLSVVKPFLKLYSINFTEKFKKNETLTMYHKKNIYRINILKIIWINNIKSILKKIKYLTINKRTYSESNVNRWMKTITEWAILKTKNYNIPIPLKYFTKSVIKKYSNNKNNDQYLIFENIEFLLRTDISLKKIILFLAIKNIPKFLQKEKKRQSIISFNDLLKLFLKNVKEKKTFRKLIRTKYPAVFIDEFQDTDIQQYKIFDLIYKNSTKTILFLIGDPKQAIYSFRGADIFSYLYARSKIQTQYYLNINWRSSLDIIKGINFLFSQNQYPFLLKSIKYTPVVHAFQNLKMNFTIKGEPQTAIHFFYNEEKEMSINEYRQWISKQCAKEICYWLNKANKGDALINVKNQETVLQSNDIAVLVRNKKEACMIQRELKNVGITSIYSSDENNIFKSSDSIELLWILKSIIEPTNEMFLKQSISTHIFKNLLLKTEKKSNKESLYFIIEKLYEYYNIWEEIGIFNMIKKIILEYQINHDEMNINSDSQKNINFLHLGELLQEKSYLYHKKLSLIRWFQNKILEKKNQTNQDQIRIIDHSNIVKIVTIHKSKGLEYPIVWIPFMMDYHPSKTAIYHHEKNFKILFDLNQEKRNLKKSEKERIAEDLRFLYVALTRSILHCSIGVALIRKKKKKQNVKKFMLRSALEYIINYQNIEYQKTWNDKLNQFKKHSFIKIKNIKKNYILIEQKKEIYLIQKPEETHEKTKKIWNVTSYTKLYKENLFFLKNKNPFFEEKLLVCDKSKNVRNYTTHNFPKGKKVGLLIHDILKNLDFIKEINSQWISHKLENYNISQKWNKMLISWIENIISYPLNNQKIFLSNLKKENYIKELKFFLPIKNILKSSKLNKIMKSLDPISHLAPNLKFDSITGFMTGSIDLIFLWNKKYYIIDYKTNWLGKNNNFYSETYMKKEIIKHRYDLQYQIYTVVMHQYLTKKDKKYNYKSNFGGIFYFFLRSVNAENKKNGIFYIYPDYSLIKQLKILFSNN
ncbi:exodeoxyribonuclease V subunit beta [Buchnera aphidicola (Muscaphis stroyani)]|uniref:RecBCD enzyme subunit RecB n=1 Tax=Buchnera aphidicola (Muscaphis stroyani) TaxID=1241869 RepID=A0A4D6YFE7_9GAMM|nr:exodeoxyribonuclease V subunit beta [Buchnera aphidicola]QCI24498.1 exodeoxyribonuclease V subunit beta [Buchnera aphidicola (Muscaphis stroyani)]